MTQTRTLHVTWATPTSPSVRFLGGHRLDPHLSLNTVHLWSPVNGACRATNGGVEQSGWRNSVKGGVRGDHPTAQHQRWCLTWRLVREDIIVFKVLQTGHPVDNFNLIWRIWNRKTNCYIKTCVTHWGFWRKNETHQENSKIVQRASDGDATVCGRDIRPTAQLTRQTSHHSLAFIHLKQSR